eukprot:539575-Prorocentrum_minimum.AAC.1
MSIRRPSTPSTLARAPVSASAHRAHSEKRGSGYILTTDQSYTGSTGIFSRRTNHTQDARVYSHNGPIKHRKRGYILTTDQSYTGSA